MENNNWPKMFSGLEDVSLCIKKAGDEFVAGFNANTFTSGNLTFVHRGHQYPETRDCEYVCEIPKPCRSTLLKIESPHKISISKTELDGVRTVGLTKITFKIPIRKTD